MVKIRYFLIKMVKNLLESSQKRPLLNIYHGDPFKNGLQRIRRQFHSRSSYATFYLDWNLWERFYADMQKFGIMGVHLNFITSSTFFSKFSVSRAKKSLARKINCVKKAQNILLLRATSCLRFQSISTRFIAYVRSSRTVFFEF